MIIPILKIPSIWIQKHVPLLEIYNSTYKFIFINLRLQLKNWPTFYPSSPAFSFT